MAACYGEKVRTRTNNARCGETKKWWLTPFSQNGLTILHEGLHLYTHPNFYALPNLLAEGVTEFFTRLDTSKLGVDRQKIYEVELDLVADLVSTFGVEILKRAYFGGDIDSLRQMYEKKYGIGSWMQFQEYFCN